MHIAPRLNNASIARLMSELEDRIGASCQHIDPHRAAPDLHALIDLTGAGGDGNKRLHVLATVREAVRHSRHASHCHAVLCKATGVYTHTAARTINMLELVDLVIRLAGSEELFLRHHALLVLSGGGKLARLLVS